MPKSDSIAQGIRQFLGELPIATATVLNHDEQDPNEELVRRGTHRRFTGEQLYMRLSNGRVVVLEQALYVPSSEYAA